MIRAIIANGANYDDIYALLSDRNVPGDEMVYDQMVNQILTNTPKQGYLTISNALQWRAQYSRISKVAGTVEGIDKLHA